MNAIELLDIINAGETSHVQFKKEMKPKQSDDIAAEMVAMSNLAGGVLLVGVEDKTGRIIGLSFGELEKINNFLFNWASNNVKPAISVFTETVNVEKKNVLVVNIPRGPDKPYCDKNMVYWIKSAANKRRVAPEELKRLYQSVGKLYAERQPIEGSGIQDVNRKLFSEFCKNRGEEITKDEDIGRVMSNLRLMSNNNLTLAGVLLFGENTEVLLPELHISAIWFWGNDISSTEYRSSDNITGNLKQQYVKALQFVKGAMKKAQADQSFNSLGVSEVPDLVFEEIIVNALVHRDYFINDSIKLFIFDNRIEIKSPGKLPNNLSIEDIRQGIQRRSRNIIITSFIDRILPYRGIGSGIFRSLKVYPHIEFENNVQAEYFKVIIYRPETDN